MDINMKISGTGHRPPRIGGYSPQASNKIVDVICMYFDSISELPEHIYWGGALGFDQALCRAGIQFKIPCTAAIPFEGYEDMWPLASRVAYKHLLSQCAEVKLISKGVYSKKKMDKRNAWLVDVLDQPEDVLLTLYNGDLNGGTYNCLQYANSRGKTIHNLYDSWITT